MLDLPRLYFWQLSGHYSIFLPTGTFTRVCRVQSPWTGLNTARREGVVSVLLLSRYTVEYSVNPN